MTNKQKILMGWSGGWDPVRNRKTRRFLVIFGDLIMSTQVMIGLANVTQSPRNPCLLNERGGKSYWQLMSRLSCNTAPFRFHFQGELRSGGIRGTRRLHGNAWGTRELTTLCAAMEWPPSNKSDASDTYRETETLHPTTDGRCRLFCVICHRCADGKKVGELMGDIGAIYW